MAIIKKFKDIPLEYGFRIRHKIIESKYPSGIKRFYVMELMQGTESVNYQECKISEVKDHEVDS